ncbi:MAG: hypothetical protein OSA99_04480 [Acidimicrobiales bacterium]|nr:hypothetical protein [Acidimicrobiales bacterium]
MTSPRHTDPDHLQRGAYWFVLHRGQPCNVVWRNSGIRYHRWSDEHRAWVEDNSLFLDEALGWLEANRSYSSSTSSEVADRVMTLDAELSAAGPAGRPVMSVEDAVEALTSVLRADPRALDRARKEVVALDHIDGGKGQNPWFIEDRRWLEWGAAKIVHDLIDVGDDPAVRLKTERCLRDAVAAVDAG